MSIKGNRISILSFEVANLIVTGSNLMQSLSKDSIKYLKDVVLCSDGVNHLISEDRDELLRIAAADKMEELKVFSWGVVRFGDLCKDPQWHHLNGYFSWLRPGIIPNKQLKDKAETAMQQLMNLAQYTFELYHALRALERFEEDFSHKQSLQNNGYTPQRGDDLAILRAELKCHKKHVTNLKKKSLWSKTLDKVVEKLVNIVRFIHMEISYAFGSADEDERIPVGNNHQKLGPAGLALHYANVVTRIHTIAICPSSVPPRTRDALYQGLPATIKSVLHSKLHSFMRKEQQLTITETEAEMEKCLVWLVPFATNTIRRCTLPGQTDVLQIQTLHHADKAKTDNCILKLVVWLHHLVNRSSSRIRSSMDIQLSANGHNPPSSALTSEELEMLQNVSKKKATL